MKVSSAIVDVLDINDVEVVFSLMSDDIMAITSTMQESREDDLAVVETRHEQQAATMASGYARSSGDVGVCILGRGPAIAQTGTALVTARKEGTPLLVVTAASATTQVADIKGFNQSAYLDSTLGSVTTVNDHEGILPAFRDAFHRLHHDEGPVAIQIAKDVITDDIELPEGWTESFSSQPATGDEPRLEPMEEDVTAIVDAYLESDSTRPPVLLVGRGAFDSEAKAAIEELSERMGAVIVTTLRAQGYFIDHPFAAGFVGTVGSNFANQLLADSDFILALGASLNEHTTDHGHLLDEATVVHVDIRASNIDRHIPVDWGVVGDVRLAAEKLTARLDDLDIDFADRFWTEKRKRRIEEASPHSNREFPAVPDRADPRVLLEELDSTLPEDRNVVIDAGHFSYWVFDCITVPNPDRLVWPIEFASIGLGLASGIGTAFASEDEQTTVTFCGDAGFLMSVQELDTAVRYEVPLIVVVMNDDGLGAEYAQLRQQGWFAEAGIVDAPDLAAVAEGFGVEAHTVRSAEKLDRIESCIDARPDGPVLLDCKVNRDVIHRRFGG
jgi:thiamine pyrophosphate-dependent acetolactate synthase large subunit-like protein